MNRNITLFALFLFVGFLVISIVYAQEKMFSIIITLAVNDFGLKIVDTRLADSQGFTSTQNTGERIFTPTSGLEIIDKLSACKTLGFPCFVRIPAGDYYIDKALLIPSGVVLSGSGMGVTRLHTVPGSDYSTAHGQALINVEGAEKIVVANLSLLGHNVETNGFRVDGITKNRDILVENVEVSGFSLWGGILVAGENIVLRNVRVHNNLVGEKQGTRAGIFVTSPKSRHTLIENSDIYHNGAFGIIFEDRASGGQVVRSRIYGNGEHGVQVVGAPGLVISSVLVYGNNITDNSGYGFASLYGTHVQFHSNNVSNNGNGGIFVSDTNWLMVVNNTISGLSKAVSVFSSSGVLVHKNQFSKNCVAETDKVSFSSFEENNCSDPQNKKTTRILSESEWEGCRYASVYGDVGEWKANSCEEGLLVTYQWVQENVQGSTVSGNLQRFGAFFGNTYSEYLVKFS
jgi:hypothetical protein